MGRIRVHEAVSKAKQNNRKTKEAPKETKRNTKGKQRKTKGNAKGKHTVKQQENQRRAKGKQ